jgi:hypothetical protein
MKALIDGYIYDNRYTSIKWQVFQSAVDTYLDTNFTASQAAEIKSKINWEQWVYEGGLAPV